MHNESAMLVEELRRQLEETQRLQKEKQWVSPWPLPLCLAVEGGAGSCVSAARCASLGPLLYHCGTRGLVGREGSGFDAFGPTPSCREMVDEALREPRFTSDGRPKAPAAGHSLPLSGPPRTLVARHHGLRWTSLCREQAVEANKKLRIEVALLTEQKVYSQLVS